MTIYDRIKEKRIELNMTQEELADKMGYKSRSAINKIEKGLRDINQTQIAKFAEVLNTSPCYLMGWTSNPTPQKVVFGTELSKIILQISKELNISYELLTEIFINNPTNENCNKILNYDNLLMHFKNSIKLLNNSFDANCYFSTNKQKELSADEEKLLTNYNKLNADGKDKVQDYTKDLTGNKIYTDKLQDKLHA